MQQFGKLAQLASLLSGLALALLGVFWIWLGASGALQPTGDGAHVASTVSFIIAVPLLAYSVHRPAAKVLALSALTLFALSMLWLAFRPGLPFERPALAQAGAIALVVLLCARIGFSWYRRRARSAA